MAKDQSRVSPFIYPVLEQAGGGPLATTLTGDVTYDQYGPRTLLLDPGTANRTVTIPDAVTAHNGDRYLIRNTGTAGYVIAIEDVSGSTLITIGVGEEVDIWNVRGTYKVSWKQGTIGSDSDVSYRASGGRINSALRDEDGIVAADADATYLPFLMNCPLPAGTLRAGTRLSMLASVFLEDAAAGTATLQTKLTIGPRYDVWQVVIAANSSAEAYGLNMLYPTAASVSYTSDASATKAEIADGLAAAWNADADCAAAATAVSDGVDTITITSITDAWLSIEEDENAAKMTTTLEVDSGEVTLIETTAVDQAEEDFQALDFEINSIQSPSATSELSGVGSWMTKTGSTLANDVVMLLPTDFDTASDMIIRAWCKFSAGDATTTARLAFLSVRGE